MALFYTLSEIKTDEVIGTLLAKLSDITYYSFDSKKTDYQTKLSCHLNTHSSYIFWYDKVKIQKLPKEKRQNSQESSLEEQHSL